MGMIHINRNRQSLGQFDEQDVADGLKSGKFLPDDLAWQEPMTEWKPLAGFASLPAPSEHAKLPPREFPGEFPGELPGSPSGPLVRAEFVAPSRPPDGTMDIGRCLEAGWNCFSVHWINLVLGTFIMFSLTVVSQTPLQVSHIVMEMFKKHGKQEPWVAVALGSVFFFFWVLAMAASALIKGGFVYFLLMSLRRTPNIPDLFAGFKESIWPQLLLGTLVTIVFVALGLLCLILPGIYFAVAFCYAPMLIIDRKMGFWDAMQLSRRTVHTQWFSVFVLVIIAGLMSVLGVLLCCVGMLGTLPLASLWLMEGYRQLFGDCPVEPLPKM